MILYRDISNLTMLCDPGDWPFPSWNSYSFKIIISLGTKRMNTNYNVKYKQKYTFGSSSAIWRSKNPNFGSVDIVFSGSVINVRSGAMVDISEVISYWLLWPVISPGVDIDEGS